MRTAALVGRVGGLAAALGAGVVIGLTAAAPASADTAETASQAAAPSAGQSAQTPRRAPAANRVARAQIRQRSAASEAAKPAEASAAYGGLTAPKAPKAAATLTRAAAAASAAASQPVSAALAVPAAAAPAPVASATSASATQPTASLLACDPRGQKIRVFKGTHVALPLNWAFFTKKVTGSATFTPDTAYDLGDVDQYDWNKLTGIAFSPLQHDRNSAMVGWRYNLTTEEFEIAPFYNVDKKRILPNEQTEVISVPADQSFTYTVDYNGITINYGDQTVYKPYPEGLKPIQLTASRVSGWFGGNEVAPRTVSYYLKLKRP